MASQIIPSPPGDAIFDHASPPTPLPPPPSQSPLPPPPDKQSNISPPPNPSSILTTLNTLLSQVTVPTRAANVKKSLQNLNSTKNRARATKAGSAISHHLLNATNSTILTLLTLLLSMITELYPAMPHYNVSLSTASIYLHIVPPPPRPVSRTGRSRRSHAIHMDLTSREFLTVFFAAITLSILIDIDYLVSQTKPINLSHFEAAEPTYVPADSLATVAAIALLLTILCKVLTILSLSSRTATGTRLLTSLLTPLKHFLPTTTMPTSLSRTLPKRLYAFAWLNLLGGLAMLTLATIALTAFQYYPHFINDHAGLPLTYLMLIKAATSSYTGLTALRNSDFGDFMHSYGCLGCGCTEWYRIRRERLREKRGYQQPRVVTDEQFMQSVNLAKFVDTAVGVWVWVGLGWAIRFGGGHSAKPVRVILGVAVTCMVVTDIVGPVLWAVFTWFVHVKEGKRRRRERMGGDGGSDDEDISTSSSDSSEGESSDEDTSESEEEGDEEEGYYGDTGYDGYDENANYYSAAATYRDQLGSQPAAVPGSFVLDRAVICKPNEFSSDWDRMEESGQFNCTTEHSPLMVDIMAHLTSASFFVIASGVMDEGTFKLYVLAQSEGNRVLIDMAFECETQRLKVAFRTEKPDLVPAVVKCLRLQKLFGDFC